jgi:hypothetical protein
MESYVTYICHRLGLEFNEDNMSRVSSMIDVVTLRSSQFIRTSRVCLDRAKNSVRIEELRITDEDSVKI